jgi:ketosteroid isomerase-like protein
MPMAPIPASVVAIFEAMNRHDAAAAVQTVAPDVEIVFGPHVMVGHDAIRTLAEQDDPELDTTNTPTGCTIDGDEVQVTVHRVSRFRSTDSDAHEEVTIWTFVLDDEGLIRRASPH